MWPRQLIERMFPDNTVPFSNEPASDLEYSNLECIATRETAMARNMMIEDREIIWRPDGSVERNVLYNVYPFPSVNGQHALSVYGGKMVQNWLQFEGYRVREGIEKKEINNAGFNYTGL